MYTLYPVTLEPPFCNAVKAFQAIVIEFLDEDSKVGANGASGTSAQT